MPSYQKNGVLLPLVGGRRFCFLKYDQKPRQKAKAQIKVATP